MVSNGANQYLGDFLQGGYDTKDSPELIIWRRTANKRPNRGSRKKEPKDPSVVC